MTRLHRATKILATLLLGLLATAAAPLSKASDPDDQLNIWEGRWKEVVETKETPYSHAHSAPTHLTCGWTADHGYMVCEYLREKTDPAEAQASDHLSIFTYDGKSKTYKHLGISKNYKTLEETASIEGNRWHYNYELPDENGKKLLLRDSYEFVTPDKRITRIEISSDAGAHWTLMSEAVGIKVH